MGRCSFIKKWKWIGGILAVVFGIGTVGGFILEQTEYIAVKNTVPTGKPVEVNYHDIKPDPEVSEITPLSKEEVLAKFPIATGEQAYENGRFLFIEGQSDYADCYWLQPSESFEDARVIFKDGELAAVKLWLKEEGELDKAFEAFGIAHGFVKARRMNEYTYVYEYAIEPMYWSHNIKSYPNETEKRR